MRSVQGRGPAATVRQFILRSLSIAATTAMMAATGSPARAVSLINPGSAPVARQAAAAPVTEVRGGHGGGGFHGGGFHGGGFRGGGFHGGGFRAAPAFHGGGFHRPAFVGGGFHRGPVFRGGYRSFAPRIYGYRHHVRPRFYGYYGPSYYYGPRYYGPRRFCRVIWTYYGPRKICRYRPWHHHHWHHRHYRVYW